MLVSAFPLVLQLNFLIIMQKTFLYQEVSISYRMEGKGTPVLLIHGFGEDSHIWDRQVEFLKEHCLLIIPDLPGTGDSEMIFHNPDDDENEPFSSAISLNDFAECLHALLQHENIPQCKMLGHSMGGYITLAFAELYPSELSGFGLIHSTAYADNEEKKANRKHGIEVMDIGGANAFFRKSIPTQFGRLFKETNPKEIDSLVEATRQFNTKACQQYLSAMIGRPDRTNVLKKTQLPVLFIIGTEDKAAPMSDVLQQTHLPAYAYVNILESTGHMSMMEAPEELNKCLLSFIHN